MDLPLAQDNDYQPLNTPTYVPLGTANRLGVTVNNRAANEVATASSVALQNTERFESFFSEFKNQGTFDSWAAEISSTLYGDEQKEFLKQIRAAEGDVERVGVLSDYTERLADKGTNPLLVAYGMALLNNPLASTDDVYNYYRSNFGINEIRSLVKEMPEHLKNEIYGQMSEVGGDIDFSKSIPGWVGFGAEFITPGLSLVDNQIQRIFTKRIEERFKDTDITESLLEGSSLRDIRAWLSNQTPYTRAEFFGELTDFIKELQGNPLSDLVVSDVKLQNLLYKFGDADELISGEFNDDKVEQLALNAANLMDVVGLGMLGRNIARATRLFPGITNPQIVKTPTSRVAEVVNPRAASDFYKALLNRDFARELNISTDAVLQTQLPKPKTVGILDKSKEVPQFLDEVADSSRELEEAITTNAKEFTRRLLTTNEKVNVVKTELDKLAGVEPTLITNRSRVGILDDETGITIDAIYGANKDYGYKTLDEAVYAVQHSFEDTGDVFEIWKRKVGANTVGGRILRGEALRKYVPKVRATEEGIELQPSALGLDEYYIVRKHDRIWHPIDGLGLGEGSVGFGSTVSNRIWSAVAPPNARFAPEIYNPVLDNFLGSQEFSRVLEEGFKPFSKLTKESQAKVHGMFEWYEHKAMTSGNIPTLNDLRLEFPDVTDKELRGFFSVEGTMKALYSEFNTRLYNDLSAQGFRTFISTTDQTLSPMHLKPFTKDEALRELASVKEAWDPVNQQAVKLTRKDIGDMYDNGTGKLTESKVTVVDPENTKASFTHQVIPIQQGIQEVPLHRQVLDFRPGYYPRIYKDNYAVIKTTRGATKNGLPINVKGDYTDRVGNLDQVVFFAPTRAAAEFRINKLNQAAKEGEEYVVTQLDALSGRQRTAATYDVLKTENRVFYDDRNITRRKNVYGKPAQIEGPVEALDRTVRTASNQFALEDLVRVNKERFFKTYQKFFDMEAVRANKLDERDISEVLRQEIRASNDPQAAEALHYWNYIRSIGGYNSDVIRAIRSKYLQIAEPLDRALRKLGVKDEKVAFAKLADSQPLQKLRSLTFLRFMVLHPGRQLLLQSAQGLMLAPLEPLYFASGAIMKDLMSMRSALWFATHPVLKGKAITREISTQAKLFGTDIEGMRALSKAVNDSGLFQSVSVHSHAGGTTAAQKVTQGRVRKAASAAREAFQKIGFNAGERNNLTFSYLVALKKYLNRTGRTKMDLKNLSKDDWDRITAQASNYALGMVRPNNYQWQNGILALPTQFMSFQVKYFMAMLGKNPAFNAREVAALWAGAGFLWGSNVLGLRDPVINFLAENDIPQDNILVDILVDGFADYALNTLGRNLNEQWGDLPVGEALAPGSPVPFTIAETAKALFQEPTLLAALGPSEDTVNSAYNYIWDMAVLFGMQRADELTDADYAKAVVSETGRFLSKGWDSVSQALLVEKYQEWYTKSGRPLNIPALPNEYLTTSLFGESPKRVQDYYALRDVMSGPNAERLAELGTVSSSLYNHIMNMMNRYIPLDEEGGPAELSPEQFRVMRNTVGALLRVFPEQERAAIAENIIRRAQEDGQSFEERISTFLVNNPDKRIVERLRRMDILSPDEFEKVRRWVNDEIRSSEALREQYLETLLEE